MTSPYVNLQRLMILPVWLSLIFTVRVSAQVASGQTFKQDSTRILQLLDSSYRFINSDYEKAGYYAEKAISKARAIGYTKGIVVSNNFFVNVLVSQGKYRKAFEVASESVRLSRAIKDERYMAKSYTMKGMTGIFLGHFQMTANNLLEAAKLIEKRGDKLEIQRSLNMLSIIFTELKNKEKALRYALMAEKLGVINKDPGTDLMTLMQLARARALNNQFAASNRLFDRLLVAAVKLKDTLNVTYTYIYSAELAVQEKKYTKALELYLKADEDARRSDFPDFNIYSNGGLARVYYEKGNYSTADVHLKKGVYYARKVESENMLRELLLLGAQIKEKQNDLKASLAFRKEYEALNAKLLNLDLQQNIHRLEEEFQSSVKEREIAKQKLLIANNLLKIKRKDNYIVLSISLVCVLGISILLIYFWYRHKQKMARKNIFLLEKEKEVQILKAMISGEETERSRLAKDLHDGVGGLLSATKMHLSILQNNPDFPDTHKHFSHTVSMLDSASHEIRMIAHNLAPELLEKLGLNKALSAYFSRLQSPDFKINYIKVGDVPRLESGFELMVYRVIQELINNVIKHAHSDHVLVQMSYHTHMLSITVEDNGIGFNGEEGIGFSNLRSRIAAVNGYMEVESSKNNGTTVFIEFDVTQYVFERLVEDKQYSKDI